MVPADNLRRYQNMVRDLYALLKGLIVTYEDVLSPQSGCLQRGTNVGLVAIGLGGVDMP